MDTCSLEIPNATGLDATKPVADYYSWGRFPQVRHRAVHRVYWPDQLPDVLSRASTGSVLPYGLGRSYGDSCLNEGRDLIDCSRMNRFLGFDLETGLICCEAGVSLAEILAIAVPHGWFLPVTPGTKFVTVGGAIANDVHGKNHHRAGTFGHHVRKLGLQRSDGNLLICTPEENPGLFRATIGGLGLTGVIVWAEIQLRRIESSQIEVDTLVFQSLDEFLTLTSESDADFEYTVAWIDCFSTPQPRGIFFRGNHAAAGGLEIPRKRAPRVPVAFPDWVLSRRTIQWFNSLYFRRNFLKRRRSLLSYEPFFYPLDSIRQWNLIYGKRGFLQYQCVIPDSARGVFARLLGLIADSQMGSFLGVIKRFGSIPAAGMISFPRPGLTLALDFAMRGESTLRLMQTLDDVVLESGGALYPAKDGRMSRTMFRQSFPEWRRFESYVDPKFSSSFWRRVAFE
ncbi:MAG TPA: FAD-binding oxidoreductase [Terriglobales bacterium]|nr:FAD-binding oxidoreductase [Terriglobales bacterium]